jgi:hypothetical protein
LVPGGSRSEDNPHEPRSSIKVGSSNPQLRPEALIAFDDNGEFKARDLSAFLESRPKFD